MRNIIYLIIMFVTIVSCEKNKKDIEIELITNQVVCVEKVKKGNYLDASFNPSIEYDSLSRNILHYKIKNISDKKYYIMLNENNLGTLERDFYKEAVGKDKSILNTIGFSLYKNDSILDGSSTKGENMCGADYDFAKVSELETIINEFLVKNSIQKKYKLEEVNKKNDFLQGYFLQPGETRYFTSIVNLPYRINQKWISNINKKKPNLGSLSLRNDSTYTRKIITQNQKREIKENGYILFDGIVYSNKVSVNLIAIKN